MFSKLFRKCFSNRVLSPQSIVYTVNLVNFKQCIMLFGGGCSHKSVRPHLQILQRECLSGPSWKSGFLGSHPHPIPGEKPLATRWNWASESVLQEHSSPFLDKRSWAGYGWFIFVTTPTALRAITCLPCVLNAWPQWELYKDATASRCKLNAV